MTEAEGVVSWYIQVVMREPQEVVPRGATGPEMYTQADVDQLVAELRDRQPPLERRLVTAELKNGQIEAFMTAPDDKPVRCGELAELCSRALFPRRPKFFNCVKVHRVTTVVGWQQ